MQFRSKIHGSRTAMSFFSMYLIILTIPLLSTLIGYEAAQRIIRSNTIVNMAATLSQTAETTDSYLVQIEKTRRCLASTNTSTACRETRAGRLELLIITS